MTSDIKINISAKIGEIDEDLKQKIVNFTNALSELPKEPSVDVYVLMNGTEYKSKDSNLKINLSGLLTDQVLKHFNIQKLLGYGGTVVGKGARIGELADKMFNLKPNEEMIVKLKGEKVIPPINNTYDTKLNELADAYWDICIQEKQLTEKRKEILKQREELVKLRNSK